MTFYENTLIKNILEKRDRRINGNVNEIEFPFSNYKDYLPTIDKGLYYGVLGASGIGKSKYIRYTYVYTPFKFSIQNNYPIKILYFALEDSKEYVYKNILTHYLYDRHRLRVSPSVLDSKDDILSPSIVSHLQKDADFFAAFENNVFIVDNITDPLAIRDTVLKFSAKYSTNNHCIVIIDNYSNIIPNKDHSSDWDAIRYLSRNIIRQEFCKLGITTIGVLQLDQESEKFAYRNANKLPAYNLEPNAGSIADAKVVIKDMHSVNALFSPFKYSIEEYPFKGGYDIKILRNRFRSLIHMKSNLGDTAPRLGLFMDGLVETFKEMPPYTDKESLDALYKQLYEYEERRKNNRHKNFTTQISLL